MRLCQALPIAVAGLSKKHTAVSQWPRELLGGHLGRIPDTVVHTCIVHVILLSGEGPVRGQLEARGSAVSRGSADRPVTQTHLSPPARGARVPAPPARRAALCQPAFLVRGRQDDLTVR